MGFKLQAQQDFHANNSEFHDVHRDSYCQHVTLNLAGPHVDLHPPPKPTEVRAIEVDSSIGHPSRDPTAVKRAPSDIYAKCLLPWQYGYPLWYPEPREGLSPEYRSVGVDIGDVGTITYDGRFDFHFNICRPADDPVNSRGVPAGFEPHSLDMEQVDEDINIFGADTDISSDNIDGRPGSVPGSFRFEGSGPAGAVLMLPEGGIRKDYQSIRYLQEYARRNAASWYQFAGLKLGRPAENGSLCLVTGCDKSPAWGVASYHRSCGAKVSCEFMGTEVGDGRSSGYRWKDHRHVTARVSRLDCNGSSQARGDSGVYSSNPRPTLNQCIFVRGFRISLENEYWHELLGFKVKTEDTNDCKLDKVNGDKIATSFLPTIHGSSLSNGKHPSNPNWTTDAVNQRAISFENVSGMSSSYHPLVSINDYLLKCVKGSKVAITHDDDWHTLLEESDSGIPEDAVLVGRISKEKIRQDGDVVYLAYEEHCERHNGEQVGKQREENDGEDVLPASTFETRSSTKQEDDRTAPTTNIVVVSPLAHPLLHDSLSYNAPRSPVDTYFSTVGDVFSPNTSPCINGETFISSNTREPLSPTLLANLSLPFTEMNLDSQSPLTMFRYRSQGVSEGTVAPANTWGDPAVHPVVRRAPSMTVPLPDTALANYAPSCDISGSYHLTSQITSDNDGGVLTHDEETSPDVYTTEQMGYHSGLSGSLSPTSPNDRHAGRIHQRRMRNARGSVRHAPYPASAISTLEGGFRLPELASRHIYPEPSLSHPKPPTNAAQSSGNSQALASQQHVYSLSINVDQPVATPVKSEWPQSNGFSQLSPSIRSTLGMTNQLSTLGDQLNHGSTVSTSLSLGWKKVVGSAAIINASNARRKRQAKFVCALPECGQTFTAKYNLTDHMLSHSGERRFACDKCHHRFITPGVARRHRSRCTGNGGSTKRRPSREQVTEAMRSGGVGGEPGPSMAPSPLGPPLSNDPLSSNISSTRSVSPFVSPSRLLPEP